MSFAYSAGVIVARDDFAGITAGTALSARTAPVGGVWATSGATTDLVASDNGFFTGSEEETRNTLADTGDGRFAILGSTNFTDTEVGVSINVLGPPAGAPICRAIARWVDASNWLTLEANYTTNLLKLVVNVAAAKTTLKQTAFTFATNATYGLRVVAFASGRVIGWLLDSNGGTLATLDASHSSLATGGALQTGKPGFNDQFGSGVSTRHYDNFYAATPAAEPIVLYAGRQMEIRSDAAIRQDSTGTYWGPVPSYLGDRPYLPCAGGPNRTTRILIKADRNDLESAEDVPLGDILRVQIVATPRYIAVPR